MFTLQFFSTMSALSHVSEVHSLLVSFTREFTFPCVTCVCFTDLIRLVVSSGFHSAVSVCSHVSQVHGSLVSLGSHSPGNSLFHVSEVHAFAASSWFHSPVSVLSCLSEVHGLLVPQGFISSEYTFPWVRGTRFSNFFRVSFSSEFTLVCPRCMA